MAPGKPLPYGRGSLRYTFAMLPACLRVVFLVLVTVAAAVRGEVLITEIMYNPNSNERYPNHVEWVEIYNSGEDPVDISGYYLEDEDGKTQGLPAGLALPPGRALVLAPDGMTVEGFRAAWGEDVPVVIMKGWLRPGLHGLANDPSPTNEVLTLKNGAGEVVDEVNFDDEGDWPSDRPDGPSIYLLPGKLTTKENDDGRNWARSEAGRHGARLNTRTGVFDGQDVGSPGYVETRP